MFTAFHLPSSQEMSMNLNNRKPVITQNKRNYIHIKNLK